MNIWIEFWKKEDNRKNTHAQMRENAKWVEPDPKKIIKRYNSNHIFDERIKRLETTNIIHKNKSSLFLKNKKILWYLNFLLILKKIFNIKN